MVERDDFNSAGIYQPHIGLIVVITAISFFLTILFFINWRSSGSGWYLGFCLVSVAIFLVFLCPIIIRQGVCVENGNITFLLPIGKPMTISIAGSLYEMVIRDDEVIRLRFKTAKSRIQVSAKGYKNGDRLMKQIKDVIEREKVLVRIIEK